MKYILLLLVFSLSEVVVATDVTCANDLSGISIREEVEIEFEEDLNRYHVSIGVPLSVSGHKLSTIYMDYESKANGEKYQHLIGAPLRWFNEGNLARTKLVLSNVEFSPSIHLEYGLCGPTHGFKIKVQ
jgi:hypothetical protein